MARIGPGQGIDISPEICAQVDEERGGPVRAILREWCGKEQVDIRSEVGELKKEVARLGMFAQAALDTLGLVGHGAEVGSLERKHGRTNVPPAQIGPQDFRYCGLTEWGSSCVFPSVGMSYSYAWTSISVSPTHERSGRYVRGCAFIPVEFAGSAWVTKVRLRVVYGVLR